MIYVPPVILLAALVWLVVILGRKSAMIKKTGPERKSKDFLPSGEIKESRLKAFWKQILNVAEFLLRSVKTGARKTETGLSGILLRMREKRTGRKTEKIQPAEKFKDLDDKLEYLMESDVPRQTERKREKSIAGKFVRRFDYLEREVMVKRKEEPIPQRIMPEIIPEDKIKEDALIHRIAENPKDIEAYRELGDYYMAVGNIKDAKDSFKMVLRLRPRDLKAKSSLREIELKMRLGS